VPNPIIDVVIPVFNGAKTVESAVATIQAQTLRDIRIIVVNDGSTDGTQAIMERLAAADDRILLIDRPNGGIVDALNAGLAACTADLIARHDADDLALPDRFEKQLDWLRSHPACSAVSGSVIHIDEADRELGPKIMLRSPDLADPTAYPQQEPYLVHPFLMMRRAAIAAVGGYRYVFHSEDSDLYWRLQETGRLANMPDLLGYYRIHDQSVTSASTLNGRIVAMSSQLGGISAMRRRAGRPDIAFPKSALAEYIQARTLKGIVRAGSRGLDADEAARLAVSASAKLLELAAYRPYELDGEDCSFIRASIMHALPSMAPASRTLCVRMLSGTAARLAAQGQVSASIRMAPARLYPLIAARLVLRTMLPGSLRVAMRKAAGRPVMVK
jgi:glycosyltransferase involved in cell wall biosynthesis